MGISLGHADSLKKVRFKWMTMRDLINGNAKLEFSFKWIYTPLGTPETQFLS